MPPIIIRLALIGCVGSFDLEWDGYMYIHVQTPKYIFFGCNLAEWRPIQQGDRMVFLGLYTRV